MKITEIERWILFSDNGFIKYYLWQENGIVRVISEDERPFIVEFDSLEEAIEHFNKVGRIIAEYYEEDSDEK